MRKSKEWFVDTTVLTAITVQDLTVRDHAVFKTT